ncbi:GGDEF and EAL domain-containing protein [Clostridium aestuarii]|uniref:GGDEF and EAL domain-containing protein n=1 Tax=Clostridium aestuarii TaxID=338193 RepID=A0ABT4D1K4_9CLOT|nr:GGDEF and EAL domain-containing protein [Clostridium aestuarii]MCY6485126.1 GGDEF and EAL domain-containing protein [Clostridium aestuarii]
MKYKLNDLIDILELREFLQSLYEYTGVSSIIIEKDEKDMVVVGDKNKICIDEFKDIINTIKNGADYFEVNCENGFCNIVIPISINGEILAIICHNVNVCMKNKFIKFFRNMANLICSLCSERLDSIYAEKKSNKSYNELQVVHEKLIVAEEEFRQQFNELQINEKLLKESDERYKLVLLGSKDGIYDWKLLTNNFFYSKQWKNMIGYEDNELSNTYESWKDNIHPYERGNIVAKLENYLIGKENIYTLEYRFTKKDGSYIWVQNHGYILRNSKGKAIRLSGSHTDITERKKREKKIYNLAFIDLVTGLPNRSYLYKDLVKLCEAKDRFSLIFIDIDKFKEINDTFGHSFGDLLLKEFTSVLNNLVGYDYKAYRWGGDEFVLILKINTSPSEVKTLLCDIDHVLGNSIIVKNKEMFITSSLGISIFPEHGAIPEELIKNADIAMYSAKNGGKNSFKNNYKIYNKELYINNLKKIKFEKALRLAVKNNEFTVFYQPQIEIQTGKVIGMEALARWITPKGKLISPAEFIPCAEEIGAIIPIGEYILKTACKQTKTWHDMGYDDLKISVNLSGRQLESKKLIYIILHILNETKLESKYLELEITESNAMKDMEKTIKLLKILKNMNISISLDDFGTGYSSLNHLRKFPLNNLKIDKSFIDEITINITQNRIIKAIIFLAHSLNLKVIAEGIETKEQLEALKQINCDEAQGYYSSKPVCSEEFEKYLKKYYK